VHVILQTIVPVFSIIAIGALLGLFKDLDTKTLSELTLYILTPFLVFTSLLESHIVLQRMFTITVFSALIFLGMAVTSFGAGYLLKFSPTEKSSFVLSTTLMNSGNLGLPLIYFAFGNEGLAIAVIFLVCFVIVLNTFGIFVAAGGHLPASQAVAEIFRLPALYAIGLTFLLRETHTVIPAILYKPIQMVGHAAIPTILLILGIQLTHANLRDKIPRISLAVFLRLIISPILAIAIFALLPADNLTRRVLIIQSSGPTAVNAIILATKYDVHPDFAGSVILVSTILSVFSLSILLALFGG